MVLDRRGRGAEGDAKGHLPPGSRPARRAALLCACALLIAPISACSRNAPERSESAAPALGTHVSAPPSASLADEAGAPRPGMAWVPNGELRAGTPPGRTPRVADEEMPGTPVALEGFYIDLLPWPNEPNAIPTSNVSRDEAEQLCASKAKRLCTELEWERACKGPENTTYEYGDTYRKDVCGTGIALEQAALRPTGEHAQCKSGFGVLEMHGGVWEWTSSSWGRGSKDGAQGVLRGGNSVAGELVGRCSNAIARAPSKKASTMGFRCCAGPKNEVEVELSLTGAPGLTPLPPATGADWASALERATEEEAALDPKSVRAQRWIPLSNEELVIVTGCTEGSPRSCALVVGRPAPDAGAGGEPLTSAAIGAHPPEISRNGSARHLRVRTLDARGAVHRDLTYAYGRVELSEPRKKQ